MVGGTEEGGVVVGEDMVEVSIGEAVDGKEGEHLQTIELLVRSVSSKIYIQYPDFSLYAT